MRVSVWILGGLCFLFAVACDGDGNNGSGGDDTDSDTDPATAVAWCDTTTDLCWRLDVEQADWYEAVDYCDNLVLDDHDDWRLPTIDELRSLVRGCPATVTGGDCPVVTGWADSDYDDICHGCDLLHGPESIKGCYWDDGMGEHCTPPLGTNWSSSDSTSSTPSARAWNMEFSNAYIGYAGKDNIFRARCVRTLN